jgi:hypothetical protein
LPPIILPPSTILSTIPSDQIPSSNNNTLPTLPINPPDDSSTNPTTIPISALNHSSSIVDSSLNTIPSIPPLRHSACIQARQLLRPDENTLAFLSKFAPLHDSHDLLPLDFHPSLFVSTDSLICAIANGSTEPDFDTGDDPSWAEALRSPERE